MKQSIQTLLLRAFTLLSFAVSSGACSSLTSVDHPGSLPSFLAYWDSAPNGRSCPGGDECVAYALSREAFHRLLDSQQGDGLEIVDFDARLSTRSEIYAGAWLTSDRPHELQAGLTWERFLGEHRRRTERGERLLRLKVYEDRGRQRVAGIWRPGDADRLPPDRVIHDQDWKHLRKADQEMREEGYYLEEIEAYPGPDGADDRFAAGVWRAGNRETLLLTGLQCDEERGSRVDVTTGPGRVDVLFFSDCELLQRLEELNGRGFQPVDFERYRLGGKEEWAVLLHAGFGSDWLQLGATAEAINQRNRDLDAGAPGAGPPDLRSDPFRILDLDLLELAPVLDDDVIHLGLVHDGGTSGPPDG